MNSRRSPTQSMLAGIGRVAGESAAVEHLLRDLFSHLIGTEYGHVITAGDDLSNIALLCGRVARYNHGLSDAQVARVSDIRRSIDAPRTARNFLIHAVWEKGSGPGEHLGLRSNRVPPKSVPRGTHEVQVWTAADANRLADQFQRIAAEIESFMQEAFGETNVPMPIDREVWAKVERVLENLDTPTGQPPVHA